MKKLTILFALFSALGMVNTAQAGTISLVPSAQSGNNISFAVNVDFTDGATIDGTFQMSYDTSILGGASFSYDPTFLTTFDLVSYAPNMGSGVFTNVGFSANTAAFGGSGTLGTLSFSVLNTGAASVASAADVAPNNNGFLNASGSSFLPMTYGSAAPQVSPIPVPAALWLMASGLGALGVALRHRS